MLKSNIKKLFLICTMLLCACCWQSVFAQQNREIKGTVSDTKGETLIGVSITVKGAKAGLGTVTDLDGRYTISVPSDAKTIVASFLGMKTTEVAITGSTVDITMAEDMSELDEVVVIGYGTVKKRDLTGSVVSVKGETLAKVPVTNAAEALTGRLAGVQITTTDGSPDADMLIRVRGGSSITQSNSPLYIIDGFPANNINDVAPTDIESIDVLKDASTTAIYGSRGANGVVIITTKGAKAGKTQVSYNGYLQSKKLSKSLKVLSPYEYVMFNYELAAFDGDDGLKTFENKFGVYDDLDLYKDQEPIDWQDDMFGANVLSYQHNISISGGNEKTRFGLSATWNKNGGLMPKNDYERLNVNFKLNHEISKTLRFSANARITDTEINGNGTSGGTYKVRTHEAVTSGPTKGIDGFKIVDPGSMTEEEYEAWLNSNIPISERSQWYWKRRYQKAFNFTGSLDWDILKELTYRVEAGYEYGFNEDQSWWDRRTSNASYVGGLPLAEWTKTNRSTFRIANTLTWLKAFNKEHNLNLMIGQEVITKKSDNNKMYATHYSKDLSPEKVFANMGLSDGTKTISSFVSPEDNMASFFGRAIYNLSDRYIATLTVRADGSSKFPKKNHWGIFPAAAFAWRINEEAFMEDTKDYLSNLKLRISYGESGNNDINNILYKRNYAIQTSKTYGLGDEANPYYANANTQMPNPNLKWETNITRNIGLDFGFWGERLSGTVEGYWNTAQDLLIEREIVAPGYKTIVENTAQTSNKGIEITLNGNIVNNKDWNLAATFNIGFNKSKIDKLANGLEVMQAASGWAGTDLKGYNDYRVIVGQPVGKIYGFVTDGYYTTSDFESYDEATKKYNLKVDENGNPLSPKSNMGGGKNGIRPGAIKFRDIDGDHEITESGDVVEIGDTNPDFTGGFGFNGGWKGFDFTMMFSFVYGNDIYNASKIASTQQYRTSNYQSNLLNIMHVDNRYTYLDRTSGQLVTDLATLAEMNEGANAKQYWSPISFGTATVLPHSWAVEDGSFLRLQNITVGYTLPRKLTQKFLCEQFRVYCTLNNVYTWTSYSGYDPEVSSYVRGSSSSALTPGVDFSGYPKSFSYTFGVNLTF